MLMKYHIGTYYTLHVSHSERNVTNSSQLYHTHARDTKHAHVINTSFAWFRSISRQDNSPKTISPRSFFQHPFSRMDNSEQPEMLKSTFHIQFSNFNDSRKKKKLSIFYQFFSSSTRDWNLRIYYSASRYLIFLYWGRIFKYFFLTRVTKKDIRPTFLFLRPQQMAQPWQVNERRKY